jgi:uncharacterized membrane protein
MDKLPWVLAGLVAAGIIHILAIFSIPELATRDAWGRLSSVMKPNVLAISGEGNTPRLPFASPDAVTAYCLFDISKDNVVVRAPLPESAWSLSLSTRSGENFYLVAGADAKRPSVRLLIIPQHRLSREASTEKTEEGGEQSIIVSPSLTGIVAIRAPLRGESFRAQAMEELRKSRCDVQKRAEPLIAEAAPEVLQPSEEDRQQSQARRRKRPEPFR